MAIVRLGRGSYFLARLWPETVEIFSAKSANIDARP
jgi:hypothetical protein